MNEKQKNKIKALKLASKLIYHDSMADLVKSAKIIINYLQDDEPKIDEPKIKEMTRVYCYRCGFEYYFDPVSQKESVINQCPDCGNSYLLIDEKECPPVMPYKNITIDENGKTIKIEQCGTGSCIGEISISKENNSTTDSHIKLNDSANKDFKVQLEMDFRGQYGPYRLHWL